MHRWQRVNTYCLQRCSVHLWNNLSKPKVFHASVLRAFPPDNMPASTRFNLFGRNSCLWTMLWKESRYALGIDISIFGVKNNGQKYSPNKPDSTSNWHFYNHFVGLSDRFAINQFGKRQFIILRAQVSHLWKTAITLSHHLHVSWLQHSDSKCELICTSKTDSSAPLRVVDT